jgi:hypothetical protein
MVAQQRRTESPVIPIARIRDDVLASVGRQAPRGVAEQIVADFLAALSAGFEWTTERREFYARHVISARLVVRTLRSHLEQLARDGLLPWDTVWQMGETALAMGDEIAETAAGQRRLLGQLLSERQIERRAAVRTARHLGWRMPETVSLVVLDGLPADLPEHALADLRHPVPRVLVPEPQGRDWVDCFSGRRVVVGPPVPPTEAARSLEQALEVRDLVQSGFITERAVVFAEDHLRALLLMRNRGLIKQLGDRTLAPLRALEPKKRARAWTTLLAWLHARGNLAEVAELLRMHPQTIRYRMKELQRLFGAKLDDPGFRIDLELALRGLAALYAGQDGLPPLTDVLRERGLPDLADEYERP